MALTYMPFGGALAVQRRAPDGQIVATVIHPVKVTVQTIALVEGSNFAFYFYSVFFSFGVCNI